MRMNDTTHEHRLVFVIVNKGLGSKVLNFAFEQGIRGATAFFAKGTVPNRILQFLEIAEVHKEVILLTIPAHDEEDFLTKLTDKFRFDRPNKGIAFSLPLTGILGGKPFAYPVVQKSQHIAPTQVQAVLTIVDKQHTDRILDHVEKSGFPRGTVIEAHGSADKSKTVLNLMLEPEKSMILILVPRDDANRLTELLTKELNLKSSNSGITAVFNVSRSVGLASFKHTVQADDGLQDPAADPAQPSYSAIFALVKQGEDEAVIQSAESAGSTGATIIHARSLFPDHAANHFLPDFELEHEVVMIVAQDARVPAICEEIHRTLGMEQEGRGQLLVVPLYSAVGLAGEYE